MVYDDGIGVGRHRRHTDTPADTIKPDVAGAIDGWVSVAAANNLKDKETLRVEVASTVMTIARNDGHLFAFRNSAPTVSAPSPKAASKTAGSNALARLPVDIVHRPSHPRPRRRSR